MNLKEYLKKQFPSDLKSLNYSRPNSVIQSDPELFRIDNNTIYFGGMDWKNFKGDIKDIENENLENFFLSLFTITVIDLTMFT